jgi:predicted signal transduction protein with EAL and GGDEF domain
MRMNRPTAEKLVRALADLDRQGNEVCAVIELIEDIEERKRFRRLIAGVMTASFDLLMPVVREHRELDPDADTEWGREMKARSDPRNEPTESAP